MKIIIDIPEQLYKEIRIHGRSDDDLVCSYIQEGTLLGNCHGRLIDADEAIKVLKSLGSRDYRRERGTIQEAIKMLSYDEYTSTIVPEDKED